MGGGRTLAPAAAALVIRVWHWERLWRREEVEVSWPTAWGAMGVSGRRGGRVHDGEYIR